MTISATRVVAVLGLRLVILLGCLGIAALNGCDGAGDEDRSYTVEIVDAGVAIGPLCERPAAVPSRAGDTIVIAAPATIPCRVVAVRSGLQLRPSSDGSHPDPSWTSVARDSRGRIITAATRATARASFLVWHADGTLSAVLGGDGEGPGEFSGRAGLLTVVVGPHDSLYVTEGMRWSVFGPDLRFGRILDLPVAGAAGRTHVTSDGSILVTGPYTAHGSQLEFHLLGSDGRVIRAFGAAGNRDGRPAIRAAAYTGQNTFWVAPPSGAPYGYVLEEWSLDGDLVRVVRRTADWLSSSNEEPSSELPQFRLHVDDNRLLWVMAIVKDARWREPRPGEDEDELASLLYDGVFEVIDPAAGVVLAAGSFDELPGEDERNAWPIGMFIPRTSVSYRPVPDENDLQTIEFFDLKLVDAYQ